MSSKFDGKRIIDSFLFCMKVILFLKNLFTKIIYLYNKILLKKVGNIR